MDTFKQEVKEYKNLQECKYLYNKIVYEFAE